MTEKYRDRTHEENKIIEDFKNYVDSYKFLSNIDFYLNEAKFSIYSALQYAVKDFTGTYISKAGDAK